MQKDHKFRSPVHPNGECSEGTLCVVGHRGRDQEERGKALTVLTEFGPPDYMWTTPYTRQPLANQWDINVHMMNTFRKRYL